MTKIVFMGSPQFAVPSLKKLVEAHQITGVVTQPDRPAGRGRDFRPCPVKEAAVELGLDVLQPEKLLHNQPVLNQIRQWEPEVIVVVAYGKILRSEVLSIAPLGCLNVHASLLPRWRGASPIQAAILHGDRQTGVSIMKLDEGMDTGPVFEMASMDIVPDDTAGSLETRLAVLGANLLARVLPLYVEGVLQPVPQATGNETYAPILKKEDGLLEFVQTVDALERKIRAFNPWPGCFMPLGNSLLKVHKASVIRENGLTPGKHYLVDRYPAVGAGDGYLILSEVQPGGKKPMDGRSFLMGYRNWLE